MVEFLSPSTIQSQLLVLRDLAVALSACIYQSLCDSDQFKNNLQDPQVNNFTKPVLNNHACLSKICVNNRSIILGNLCHAFSWKT